MQFDEFLSVIDLLKDTKKYEAKVAELTSREDSINAAIAQMNEKSGIISTLEGAQKKLAEAAAVLEDAQVQKQSIIAGAQAAYDKRNLDLKAREIIADQAVANYNTIKNQQAAREDMLRAKEKEADALRASLQKQQDALTEKQLEVDERLAKLRQVMG